LACGAFALLSYARARADGRVSWWPGILGALAGFLHPWQGEVLVLTVLGAELSAVERRAVRPVLRPGEAARVARRWVGSARGRLTLATFVLLAIPLLYYVMLAGFDRSWRLAEQASPHGFPALATVTALAPLALVALLGYRGTVSGFLGRAVRVWPVAMLAVYLVSSAGLGSTPLHALDGVTLPLAVLAVDGCRRAGWGRLVGSRMIATGLIAVFTVPATLYEMNGARDDTRPSVRNSGFVTAAERRALDYLALARPAGGVLTGAYLGAAVPGWTGRATYVGHCIWSQPDCAGRIERTDRLLGGRMSAAGARAFVRGSEARFVLADCAENADLTRALGSLLASVRRFGCATVYVLRGQGPRQNQGPRQS
jgi:hypothetical protein